VDLSDGETLLLALIAGVFIVLLWMTGLNLYLGIALSVMAAMILMDYLE
jgi:predicted small integral membrane protein